MAKEPDTVPRERTALSWSRTAITANIVLAPMLFVTIKEQFWELAALGAVTALAGSLMTMRLRRRYRELRATRVDLVVRRGSYSPYWALAGVSLTVVAGAVGGALTGVALVLRP